MASLKAAKPSGVAAQGKEPAPKLSETATKPSAAKSGGVKKVNINVEEYWDAILFFRSLKLAQLDIKGNAVASKENFRTIVMMLIPCLKWFDGEDVN
uniref:Uncharacterized protein n=1 Tax=Zea mays TaxID=4577 RepID=B6UDS2_MAIZE|nr:hypothetical protein [Zea mays]